MSADAARGALEAIERILNRGGDTDDVLRAVVAVLHERLAAWAAVVFDGGDAVVAGAPDEAPTTSVPIEFERRRVAGLAVAGYDDAAVLERVATLISPYAAKRRAGRVTRSASPE